MTVTDPPLRTLLEQNAIQSLTSEEASQAADLIKSSPLSSSVKCTVCFMNGVHSAALAGVSVCRGHAWHLLHSGR